MSERFCKWLHEQLELLPEIKFPFRIQQLSDSGIYFFYEQGEYSDHGSGIKQRIVRIGTSREGNLRKRISEHFLLNNLKMNFTQDIAKPADRSVFRLNIGKALLKKANDDYLKIWNIDFTTNENRQGYGYMRNLYKEKQIESQITKMLREKFSFRYFPFEGQDKRMGMKGIESRLIGTVANCNLCKPTNDWLGKFSPVPHIKNGKLWQVQHLNSGELLDQDKDVIKNIINERRFIAR